ncbi:MAG: sugar-binding transcriptional regulator [Anaerolineaceae bacterium]
MYTRDEVQLMVQVARLYYEYNLTQEEIAVHLNITRQKASRLLISAREHGIVKTIIVDPFPRDMDLTEELKMRFNLKDVEVVPGELLEGEQLRTGIGLAAAGYIHRTLRDNQTVGIGWGRSLHRAINLIPKNEHRRIHAVPLIGGIGDVSPFFQVNELAAALAATFSGTYRPLYAPAFIEQDEVLHDFLKTQEVVQISEYWSKLDVAIVGIGQVEFQKISSMFFAEHITRPTLAMLEEQGAVGDICARFFNTKGLQVLPNLGVIGIQLDQLKSTPQVIGIAGGMEKINAILGALRGGYVKTLITDAATAQAVLVEDKKEVI